MQHSPGQHSDRRLVTVMFADIDGLTRLAEENDIAPGSAAFDSFVGDLTHVVQQRGGVLDTLLGDGLMALFGAPVAHEDDAERAVEAAMAIDALLSSFNAQRSLGLTLRIGINTGFVVAGAVGTGASKVYSVIGDAVNVAARLCERSLPGEILVGAGTSGLVGSRFRLRKAGEIAVRGRRGAVVCYRVTGEGPSRRTRRHRLPRSPLVGREREQELVLGSLRRLAGGAGGVLLIVGEPGVGKTRLLDETRKAASRMKLRWVEGRVPAFGLDPAHSVVRALAESYVSSRQQERAPAQRAAEIFGGRAASAPGLSSGGGAHSDLSTRFRAYLREASRSEPLVVALDDIHWLDSSSIALLETIVPEAETARLLFVLAGRPEPSMASEAVRRVAGRLPPDHYTEIVLGPLSAPETGRLLRNLLGTAAMPLALEHLIDEKAEGNPFFLEQLLRHLLDLGVLSARPEGGYMLREALEGVEVPDTIRGMIAARIDRLSDRSRTQLRTASVIGRQFSRDLLATAMGASPHAPACDLAELEDAELISEGPRGAESVFSFRHALVQEVAYEGMLLKSRKAVHRRVGRAVERSRLGAGDFADVLAYHFSRGEKWEKAQDYLIEAAGHANRIAATADALHYYQRAISALLAAFDQRWTIASTDPVDWFLQRLEPFWQMRRLDSLLDSALLFEKKVSSVYGPTDARTLAAQGMVASCHLHRGSYAQAAAILGDVLEQAECHGTLSPRGEAQLLLLLGIACRNLDDMPRAEVALRRSLALAQTESSPNPHLVPRIYSTLSSVLYLSGRIRDDLALTQAAVERPDVRASGEYWVLLTNLVDTHVTLGEWEEAVALGRRCVRDAVNEYVAALALHNLGLALHALGDLGEAERSHAEAARLMESQGKTVELADVLKDLADTRLRQGRPEEAGQAAERALALIRDLDRPSNSEEAMVLAVVAGVEMARGDVEAAGESLRRSFAIARKTWAWRHPIRAELLFRRAELLLRTGRERAAADDLRQAMRLYRNLGVPDHPRAAQMRAEWQRLRRHLQEGAGHQTGGGVDAD